MSGDKKPNETEIRTVMRHVGMDAADAVQMLQQYSDLTREEKIVACKLMIRDLEERIRKLQCPES